MYLNKWALDPQLTKLTNKHSYTPKHAKACEWLEVLKMKTESHFETDADAIYFQVISISSGRLRSIHTLPIHFGTLMLEYDAPLISIDV